MQTVESVIHHRRFFAAITVAIGISTIAFAQSSSQTEDKGLSIRTDSAFDAAAWRLGQFCGPNAAYTFLQICDVNVLYSDVLAQFSSERQRVPATTSIRELVEVIMTFGLPVRGARVSLETLVAIEKPVICHVEPVSTTTFQSSDNGHFVVVLDINNEAVTLIDGSLAILEKRPLEVFVREWTGNIVAPDGALPLSWSRQLLLQFISFVVLVFGAILVIRNARRNVTCQQLAIVLIIWGSAVGRVGAWEIEEVRERIQESRSGIKSLSLTIRRTDRIRNQKQTSKDDAISVVDFKSFGNLRNLSETSVQLPIQQSDILLDEGRQREVAVNSQKPMQVVRTCIYDGSTCLSSVNNTAEIIPNEVLSRLPGSRFDVYYLRCVGWFIGDPTAPNKFEKLRQDSFIPETLHARNYTISDLTRPGVSELHLLAKTADLSDQLWLDPNRAFVLLRRERTTKNGTFQVECSNFKEIFPGLWLPMSVRARTLDLAGNVQNDSAIEVEDARVNHLTQANFVCQVPPKAFVADYESTVRLGRPLSQPVIQFPAVGSQELDNVVEEGMPHVHRSMSYLTQHGQWLAGFLCFAIVVAMLLVKFRKSRVS